VGGGASNTIIIVDDNPRVLVSITKLVSRGGFVAAAFGRLAAALQELNSASAPPAAGIIDIFLERGRQGFELCELLRERFGTAIPIVMITGYDPGRLPPPYWSASACEETTDECSHFLGEHVPVYEKPIDRASLNTFLVRAAIVGRLHRSPAVLREGVAAYALQRRLTPQEARVLAYLAGGSMRSSLPSDLGLSKDTVKSQIRNLLEKCKVNGTGELIAALLKYISESDPS
jgi:FixJ family two-component response regulator